MTSDDKKHDNGINADHDSDHVEIEEIVSGIGIDDDLAALDELAAQDSADEIDMDGGEDFTFDIQEKQKGGGMKRAMAPLLVLIAAGGLGGYIVMNPDIVSKLMGGDAKPPVHQFAATPSAFGGPEATPDMPAQTAAIDPAFPAEELPQPSAAMDNFPAPVMPEVTQSAELAAPVDPIMTPEIAAAPETPAIVAEQPVQENVVVADASPTPRSPENVTAPAVSSIAEEDVIAARMAAEAPATQDDLVDNSLEDGSEIGSADDAPVVQAVTEAEAVVPAMPPVISSPQPVDSMTASEPPVSGTVSGAMTGNPQGTMGSAAPLGSNDYYESGINLPKGVMAKETMRVADPQVEPGQKMIIARKDYGQSSQEALLESASRALKLQRYDAALEMYEQLYAKNKRDHRILMGLAVSQQYAGRSEAAIQTYEALLDLDPRNANALVNMLGLLRQQYPEVALRRLLDLQDKFPNNAGIAAQIGVTQADLGHYDDAVRYMQIAASLEPHNPQHMFNLAVIADRKGAVSDAIKYYEAALESDAVYAGGRTLSRESIYDRLSKLRQR